MKRVIRLTESDLVRLIKRVINEQETSTTDSENKLQNLTNKVGGFINKIKNINNKTQTTSEPSNDSNTNTDSDQSYITKEPYESDDVNAEELIKKAGTVEQKVDTVNGEKITRYIAYGVGEVSDISFCEKLAMQDAFRLLAKESKKTTLSNVKFIGGRKQYIPSTGKYKYYAAYQISVDSKGNMLW